MFILRFIRYIRGYIYFSASGNFVERFINLLARGRVNVWGTKKKGKVLYSYVAVKDYDKLLDIADQTGTEIQIQKETGVPYNKKKYQKRKGIAIGFILFVLFIAIMSRFIWSIDITGNEKVSTEQVFDALRNSGVKVGTYIGGVDFDIVQQKVLLQLDDVSWMGYILDGTKLVVEIKEEIKAPELVGKNEPCNVVAKKSGVITKLSVYEGFPEVEVGDAVSEGDLIVNSIITTKKGNSVNHARAEVIAQIDETIEFPVVMEQTASEYTGNEQNKVFFGISNKKIPISFGDVEYDLFDIEVEKKEFSILGMDIPIYLYKEKYKEYVDVDVVYTSEQAKAEAIHMKINYVENNLGNCEIIGDEMNAKEENGVYILEVRFVYEEDIGMEQPILMNN